MNYFSEFFVLFSFFFPNRSCIFLFPQCRPSPSAAAKGKVARCYTGPLDAPFVADMVACRAAKAQKLIMQVTKLYSSSDGRSFDALARIYSGTCKPGQRVRVLGEGYVPNEDDRSSTKDDTAPTCQLPSRHERALVISRSEQASSRVYPGPLQVVGLRLSAEPVRTALGGVHPRSHVR